MNPNSGKREPIDPEDPMRMLELELMQQRAARQQAGTPYRGLRAVALIFLFFVILAGLAAFYYVFFMGGLEQARARNSTQPSPSAAADSNTP